MSTPHDDGGPAFPIADGGTAFPVPYGQVMSKSGQGMSLRDWFAGQALNGEISSESEGWCAMGEGRPKLLAENAYRIADAMLAARKEQTK